MYTHVILRVSYDQHNQPHAVPKVFLISRQTKPLCLAVTNTCSLLSLAGGDELAEAPPADTPHSTCTHPHTHTSHQHTHSLAGKQRMDQLEQLCSIHRGGRPLERTRIGAG